LRMLRMVNYCDYFSSNPTSFQRILRRKKVNRHNVTSSHSELTVCDRFSFEDVMTLYYVYSTIAPTNKR